MEEVTNTQKLTLEGQSIAYLDETRKWTMFLSVLGFVFIGLAAIMFLFINPWRMGIANEIPMAEVGMGIGVVFMLIFLTLYFFPIYFLYKFSVHSKKALYQNSEQEATEAFKFLKYHYKFMGILAIIILSFYLIIILIGAAVGAFSSMWM